MNPFRFLPFVALLALIFAGCSADEPTETADAQPAAPASEAAAVDTTLVQAVMMNYIERTTDDGTMALDGRQATFDYLHAGLKREDRLLVSCADFTTPEGTVYDVDYYVDPSGEQMEVARVVLHKKDGEPVNEVLWARDQQDR